MRILWLAVVLCVACPAKNRCNEAPPLRGHMHPCPDDAGAS
jgi:hypothetical protein